MAIKILRDGAPIGLHGIIKSNMTTLRRKPQQGRFFDTSKIQLGRHFFGNRLNHLNDLEEPWFSLPQPLSNDAIRRILKDFLNFDFK